MMHNRDSMKLTWPSKAGMLFFVGLLLAGCESVPVRPTDDVSVSAAAAESAQAAGEYVVAAREYERLAAEAKPPQKQLYQLREIDVLLKAGQVPKAREKVGPIDVTGLDRSFLARKRIIEARVAAADGAHERAMRLLDAASAIRKLSPELFAEIYAVRARSEAALDNPIGAIRNLIAREKYLVGEDALADNQLQLWKILDSQTHARLKSELNITREPLIAGWIELALAVRESGGHATRLANAVTRWRNTHPKHPAGEALLTSITSRRRELIGRFDRVAVLLPLTSDYRVAAEAVRDGFIAMHTSDPNPEKPRVTIYDIGADPEQAAYYYDQATQQGAQFIIGPLGRNAAENVTRNASLTVPTLLLSHIDERAEAGHIFQFGLPPEQEARQAAERAYLDGHRQAAVLYPHSAWGERLMNAFVSQWQRLGGLVLSSEPYFEQDHDFSDTIKRLLNILQSEQRRTSLAYQIRRKLEFEPRPRQDIDFIFLAADAKRGRLIKPQLNFYHASRIPVYATSHIFTGRKDPVHDTDLDGVQFSDMPWMLVNGERIQRLREVLQLSWPHAYSELDRLFALGVDSYAILPHLNHISQEHAARFTGVTSGLSLDRDGRLHRQLIWARFHRGVPQLIDTYPNLPDRLVVDKPPGR